MRRLSPRWLLWALGLICAISVGAALIAQHHFGMEPCPWCILQRLLFIKLAGLCWLASSVPGDVWRRLLSAVGIFFSGAGIAAAWWQHFVAARSTSCALTLADRIIGFFGLDTRWPEVFEVRASCADAAVNILGIPFEFWSMALFMLAGVVLAWSTLTSQRRA